MDCVGIKESTAFDVIKEAEKLGDDNCLFYHLPNHPPGQDMTQDQFLSGV